MRAFASARIVAAAIALLGSIACGATTPTEPSAPAPVYELKTETFAGNVKAGGTTAFPFTVVNPGEIHVAITALGPISTLTMGIAMGYWDAVASTCAQQLSTPDATINVAYAANASCTRRVLRRHLRYRQCSGLERLHADRHALLS